MAGISQSLGLRTVGKKKFIGDKIWGLRGTGKFPSAKYHVLFLLTDSKSPTPADLFDLESSTLVGAPQATPPS